jgi:hypothetical protein
MKSALQDTGGRTDSPASILIFLGNDLLSPLSAIDLSNTASYLLTHADLLPSIPGLTPITVTDPRQLASKLETETTIHNSLSGKTVFLIIDTASIEGVRLGEHCHNVLDIIGLTVNITLLLPFRFEREIPFQDSSHLVNMLTKRIMPPTFIAYPAPPIVSKGQERYFRHCRDSLVIEHINTLIALNRQVETGDAPPTP